MPAFVCFYDSPLRFLFHSQTRPEVQHLVDLTSYGNAGRCTCEHFRMRLEPKLVRGAKASPMLRCTHIELAREKFTTEMLNRVAAAVAADRRNRGVPEYDTEED